MRYAWMVDLLLIVTAHVS